MQKNPEQIRQTMGCGWLPLPAENLIPFRRVTIPAGWKGPVRKMSNGSLTNDPETCPIYTTALPEVIEIARARLHWKQGGPSSIGVADWQDHPLIIGIEILEGASNATERWAYENPVKK